MGDLSSKINYQNQFLPVKFLRQEEVQKDSQFKVITNIRLENHHSAKLCGNTTSKKQQQQLINQYQAEGNDEIQTQFQENEEDKKPVQKQNQCIIISGSSGVGKSTLINRLLKEFPYSFDFSTSHTTRKPREGEKDGVDYHFVSEKEFVKMVDNDEFIEYETNYKNYYGTSKKEIEKIKQNGRIPLLDIDCKGLIKVLESKSLHDPIVIYILLKSSEEVRDRLVARGKDSEEQINIRIQRYEWDVELAKLHPLVSEETFLVNDQFDETYEKFKQRMFFDC